MRNELTIESSVIENFKNGNIESFEQIYKFYYKRIYHFCYNHISLKSAIEDVVQNTFIDVFQSVKNLDNPKFFNKWIFRIAYFECQNYHRKKYHDNNSSLEDYILYNLEDKKSLTVQQLEEFDELKDFLEQQFSTMSIKDHNIATLKYFNDFSTKEISQVLHIPIGTVKSRSHKIKSILISALNKLYNES